ncbi:MAG: hypothetical protein OXR72_07170 [Gemmatimonadota bacterium]|nr:hypothetical protein [Gemmatimonadota bacterium]
MANRFTRALVNLTVSSLILIGVPSVGNARNKSPAGAAVLSLVLPGLGEFYAGGRRSARFFLVAEGLLWSGMATFRFLESYRVDAYHAHAAAHAGIRLRNLPESFIKEVGDFESIYERNRRERFLAGEHANLRAETVDRIWEWDTEASRIEFLDLRSKATSAEQKAFLFIGGLILNRFASALNAASIARKSRTQNTGVKLLVDPRGGLYASIRRGF